MTAPRPPHKMESLYPNEGGSSMSFSRRLYHIFAWLFIIGVILSVLFAGMVAVARISDWQYHTALGHSLGLPLVAMLITMYTGRLPAQMKRLTWLLFAAYFLQSDVLIFMRQDLPLASAIHPVIALFDFAIGWNLALRANSLLSEALPAK